MRTAERARRQHAWKQPPTWLLCYSRDVPAKQPAILPLPRYPLSPTAAAAAAAPSCKVAAAACLEGAVDVAVVAQAGEPLAHDDDGKEEREGGADPEQDLGRRVVRGRRGRLRGQRGGGWKHVATACRRTARGG